MRAVSLHSWNVSHPHAGNLLAGIWRLSDPKIALASFVPFLAGVALARVGNVHIDPLLALSAYAAIFLVEVGKNAVNDLIDYRSGADQALRDDERSPFSGGKRVLVDHLLTERELGVIAWVCFAAAAAVGAVVTLSRRPELFLLGAAAGVVAIAYSLPPLRLSYRGFGELAVGLTYGPGIVLGTTLLLGGAITREAVVVSTTLGILIAMVLLANEIPDERVDRLAGKRTLAVRLGRDRTIGVIELMFVAAFAIAAVVAADAGPLRLFVLLAGVPSAAAATSAFASTPDGPPVRGQLLTLVTYCMTGICYVVMLLSGFR